MDGDFNVALWDRGAAALNQRLCLLRNKPQADSRFLAYVLPDSLEAINKVTYATTVKHLSSWQVLHIDIYAPDIEEQCAIADFLDQETAQIDALVAKQGELIGLLRERRAAVIESSMSHVEPTGARLKHYARSVRQGWSPQCYSWPADGVTSWAVLKVGSVNGGLFRPEENKELPREEMPRSGAIVRKGDLIVSRANTRELVGSAAVVDAEFPRLMLSDKLYAYELDDRLAIPRFVALVLGSRRWRGLIETEATGASSSMLNISQDDIANLPMALPSVDSQWLILDRLDKQTARIDTLIAKAEEHIALAKERRAALITAAVTGQIDVRTARKAG